MRLPLSSQPAFFGNVDEISVFDGLESHILADGATVPFESVVSMRGWATESATEPAASVVLVVDGSSRRPVPYELPRPDIVRYFGVDELLYSGFAVTVRARELGPGEHTLAVRVTDAAGNAFKDLAERRIRILSEDAPSTSSLPRLPPGALDVTLDTIDDELGRSRISDDDTLWRFRVAFVRGVAQDLRTGKACSEVRVVLDDQISLPAIVGFPSEATAHGRCGFKAIVPTEGLALGPHTLRAIGIASDRTGYASSVPVSFVLRPFGSNSTRTELLAETEPQFELATYGTDPVYFRGWALDAAGRVAQAAFLLIDGNLAVDVALGQERPDLVTRFGSEHVRYAGFVARCSPKRLAAGTHRVRLITFSNEYRDVCESADAVTFEVRHG